MAVSKKPAQKARLKKKAKVRVIKNPPPHPFVRNDRVREQQDGTHYEYCVRH